MQLWLSYSTELTLDESLLFISTGVSSTAAEGFDIKEAQVGHSHESLAAAQHSYCSE